MIDLKSQTATEHASLFGTYLKIKYPPKLSKIVLNSGVGKAVANKKFLDIVMANMGAIAGQKPVLTLARQSNANFNKLRKGQAIGCKVTLRRTHMLEFKDRLLRIVLPRIPDFQGLNAHAIDSHGNFTMGLSDYAFFPECDLDQERMGLDITFVTTARTREAGYALLLALGIPFKNTLNKE